MKFKWSLIDKPAIILAPMANITTLPFRSICKEMGADIVFTPMISSNAVIYNSKETLEIVKFLKEEQPVIIQIFGYDGELIAKAANIVNDELKPAGIDINIGCPAPKITGNECGSGLLRDLGRALNLIKIVRNGFSGQLSVKLRLGWSEYNTLDFTKKLQEIGIDAISVHGRTAKQGYSGKADWQSIYEIANTLTIPVIGNGDITTWEDAKSRLENSKLAGIMIGRGSLGNPWLFKEIREQKNITKSGKEIVKIIRVQVERHMKFIGEEKGIREMRKHLGWYIKGFPGAGELRKQAVLVNTMQDIENILSQLELLEN
jgi:nifR3 family TIM-barrel protein